MSFKHIFNALAFIVHGEMELKLDSIPLPFKILKGLIVVS